MTDEEDLEILKDSLYHFGYSHQATKAIEEMSELTKELCKEKDGQHNREQIAEEIADVLITLDQLILYHDIYNDVAEWRTVKMNRLRQRVFLEQYG